MGYKNFAKKTGISAYGFLAGYDDLTINPIDKGLIDLSRVQTALVKNITPLEKDFSTYYGAIFPGQVWDNMIKKGTANLPVANFYYSSFSPADPDDITKIHNNFDQYIGKNVSRLILAKSDDAFKAQEAKMIVDMKKLGLDKMLPWYKKQMIEAQTIYNKLTK